MDVEIKDCPLCNSPAGFNTEHGRDASITWIACTACGLQTPRMHWMGNDDVIRRDLLAAWNHRHSGGDGEDSARLDYIERTFSGMTNRERYLPIVMIWGKGANGRTLREACDKYMAKDAARAGDRG